MNMKIYNYILNELNNYEWLNESLEKLWIRICNIIRYPEIYDYIYKVNGMPDDMEEIMDEIKNDAFSLFKQLYNTLDI